MTFIIRICHLKQSSESEIDDRQYSGTSRSLFWCCCYLLSLLVVEIVYDYCSSFRRAVIGWHHREMALNLDPRDFVSFFVLLVLLLNSNHRWISRWWSKHNMFSMSIRNLELHAPLWRSSYGSMRIMSKVEWAHFMHNTVLGSNMHVTFERISQKTRLRLHHHHQRDWLVTPFSR